MLIDVSKYFATGDQAVNFIKFEVENSGGLTLPCNLVEPIPTLKKLNWTKLIGGDMGLFGDYKLVVIDSENIKIYKIKWSSGEDESESEGQREGIQRPSLEEYPESLETYTLSSIKKIGTMLTSNNTELLLVLTNKRIITYTNLGEGKLTLPLISLDDNITEFSEFAAMQNYICVPMGAGIFKLFFFDEDKSIFEENEIEMGDVFIKDEKLSLPQSVEIIIARPDPTNLNIYHLFMASPANSELYYILVSLSGNNITFTLKEILLSKFNFVNIYVPLIDEIRAIEILVLKRKIQDMYYREMGELVIDNSTNKIIEVESNYRAYIGVRNMLFSRDGLAINLQDNLLDIYSQDLPYTSIYTHSFGFKDIRAVAILENVGYLTDIGIKVNYLVALSGNEMALYEIQNSKLFITCPEQSEEAKEEASYEFAIRGVSGTCQAKQNAKDSDKNKSCWYRRLFKLNVYPYSLEAETQEQDYKVLIICCSVALFVVIVLIIALVIWCKKYKRVKSRMKKYLECHDIVGRQLGGNPPISANPDTLSNIRRKSGNIPDQSSLEISSPDRSASELQPSVLMAEYERSQDRLNPSLPSQTKTEQDKNDSIVVGVSKYKDLPAIVNSKEGSKSARNTKAGNSVTFLAGARRTLGKNSSNSSLVLDRSALRERSITPVAEDEN